MELSQHALIHTHHSYDAEIRMGVDQDPMDIRCDSITGIASASFQAEACLALISVILPDLGIARFQIP